MTINAVDLDRIPWYHNPNRKCLNDWRFTNLPGGAGADKVRGELAYMCMTCPVLNECFKDASEAAAEGRLTKVFQGGQEWE